MEDERMCTMMREVGVHLWFKQTISTRKIMCTVFWDRQGVLLVEFLPQGTTINSAVYCETMKKLRHAIQNKRRGMLSAIILCFTKTLGRTLLLRLKTSSPHLGGKKWTTPPYSPDLAPSDFHLFLHLKKFLGGKRFDETMT